MRLSLRTRWLLAIAVAIACYRLQPWHNFYQTKARQRAAAADSSTGDIEIAVVWPAKDDASYLAGAQLAATEINNAGGVKVGGLQRNIVLRAYDESSPLRGERIARQIGRDPSLVAVIGHSSPASAVPAAASYESWGILYVSPISTVQSIPTQRFDFVFRTVPSDQTVAQAIIKEIGQTVSRDAKIVMLYPQGKDDETDENEMPAIDSFLDGVDLINQGSAAKTNVDVAFQSPCPPRQQDFWGLYQKMREHEFDLVVIADTLPGSANLREQLITAGVNEPIFDLNGFQWGRTNSYMEYGRDLDEVHRESLPRYVIGQLPREVAVLSARTMYGKRFAALLVNSAARKNRPDSANNVRIAFSETYPADKEKQIRADDYWALTAQVSKRRFDAIVIADDHAARTAGLVRLLREQGVLQPIFLGSALDTSALHGLKAQPGTRTLAATAWDATSQESQRFAKSFAARHQVMPGLHAAQGYQTVMLLKRAIERRNSIVPRLVAEALRHSADEGGYKSGRSLLALDGEVDKGIKFQELIGDKFSKKP